MAFVIDASVVGAWMFTDEHDVNTDLVLETIRRERAVVPTHWWFEIRNMLILGERRGRISESKSLIFLGLLSDLPIAISPLPREFAVLALARTHRLTFFDAAYLELASREKMPLATLDRALIAAARAEGTPLLLSTRDS